MKLNKLLLQRVLPIGAGVAVIGAAIYAYSFPAIGALVCPSCFGMERLSGRLIVEAGMAEPKRRNVQTAIRAGTETVRSFYGSLSRTPFIVVCGTPGCDRRMGGVGVNALTISAGWFTVVRVSSNGIETGFLAHELSHVELHTRVGLAALGDRIPAWFDEGVAVVVSGDRRFIRPGTSVQQRCRGNGAASLPAGQAEWTQMAMRQPTIYADAGCKVLRWMERHGGRAGVLAAIDTAGRGGRLPE